MAPGLEPERHGVVRVEREGLLEQPQRLAVVLRRGREDVRQRPEVEVVGVEAPGRLAPGALDLGPPERRLDRAGHPLRHPVLEVEHVRERAVEALRPEMGAALGVDQLARDAHPLASFADAALEHVAHAQLAPDLPHVDGLAPVGEARVAGDDEQARDPRQGGGDVLDDPVREVALLRVAAQVVERQHRERGLVGQRQRGPLRRPRRRRPRTIR